MGEVWSCIGRRAARGQQMAHVQSFAACQPTACLSSSLQQHAFPLAGKQRQMGSPACLCLFLLSHLLCLHLLQQLRPVLLEHLQGRQRVHGRMDNCLRTTPAISLPPLHIHPPMHTPHLHKAVIQPRPSLLGAARHQCRRAGAQVRQHVRQRDLRRAEGRRGRKQRWKGGGLGRCTAICATRRPKVLQSCMAHWHTLPEQVCTQACKYASKQPATRLADKVLGNRHALVQVEHNVPPVALQQGWRAQGT